jgi:hypothetical protein
VPAKKGAAKKPELRKSRFRESSRRRISYLSGHPP